MPTFFSEVTSDIVDELVKSSTLTFDEILVHEKNISEVHGVVV